MESISERCESSIPSVLARYDLDITRANGNNDARRWVSLNAVIHALRELGDGDDMVIHHVGFADPDVLYG